MIPFAKQRFTTNLAALLLLLSAGHADGLLIHTKTTTTHHPRHHHHHQQQQSTCWDRAAWLAPPLPVRTTATVALGMAPPGVELASNEELQTALANPETVVLDIRSVAEISETGYWNTSSSSSRRWHHAPGSRQENPLLSTAAKALIPDPKTPVIVYCATGMRAAKAKEILEGQGYENVLNAGGYPADVEGL